MMRYNNLEVEQDRDGKVTTISLNRPDRRNALTLEMMRELIDVLNAIERQEETCAVILGATGTVFCAGHDLSELQGCTARRYREIFHVCTEVMNRIQTLPQPVIARVQGVATAAGCQLVATCDLAIASDKAGFATPGVKIGLFCTTPMVALTRAIARKHAMEMLLTGELIDAQTALQWGLVNRVVPSAVLAEEAHAWARHIASASSFVVSIGKQAFYSQIDLDQPKAYAYAQEVMTMNSLAEDASEGIRAFLEKRQPSWKGR